MKRIQKKLREYEIIKAQLKQTAEIVNHTKSSNLWSHEASIRKKIKLLNALKCDQIKDFDVIFDSYLSLFDTVSSKLLELYNQKNNSSYKFEEVVKKDRQGYLSSGIIAVLITSHIPDLVADDFEKYFPINPKDEYPNTRRIKRKMFLHLGETNTGKTFHALERLKNAQSGIYLAPLRILALENYEKLNNEGVPCNLLTGEEEVITDNAEHICSTIEKLNLEESYDVAVIDEIQMIENLQRGQAWARALLGLKCSEIHVCGALNAKELIIKILDDCGDEYEIIEYHRQTPLIIDYAPFDLRHISNGDALVAFSKKRVLELSKYFLDKGIRTSVIYGDLPPEVRKMQYQAFLNGESGILITTDAIGMGVNLPIRRIIFMSLQKFDGEEIRYLTSQEIKQISGRAGRKGIYEVGYVGTDSINQLFIKENLDSDDEPLSFAVLGPSEAILKIGNLSLREKLALWSTRQEELNFYKKMDVRDYLIILDAVKAYKLPQTAEYKLMKLPFNVNDSDLLQCLINYVDELFKKNMKRISKPNLNNETLIDFELYYQKINLYYSFSKNFELDLDEAWVYNERKILSEKINQQLLNL